MWRALSAGLAELRELETRLNGLLVLLRVVVQLAARGALKLDKIVLGHKMKKISIRRWPGAGNRV